MSTDPKDKLAAWKKATAKKAQPSGAADSVMKKALELNPNLKGGLKTEEFLDRAAAAQREHQAKRAEPAPVAAPSAIKAQDAKTLKLQANDLPSNVEKAKHFLKEEELRISAAIVSSDELLVALEAKTKKQKEAMRARVAELFARVDPSLGSPRTQALLAEKGGFLRALGLDVEALRKDAQRIAATRSPARR